MHRLINLTPHPVLLVKPDDSKVIIAPSGKVARCSTERKHVTTICDMPVYEITYGKVEDLPPSKDNTFYIVSTLVKESMKGKRSDLVSPIDFVRDNTGNISGCKALAI